VFPALEATGLVSGAFSTRLGGVSSPPFDALNLGLTTRDEAANVMENRRRFAEATGIPLVESLTLDHGTQVHCATEVGGPVAVGDAVVTDVPGVPITLYYADCCPIFIVDPMRPAVGLVHAGWRGTVANVVAATMQAMAARYGTRPGDCLAGIASSIGPCCFEVDREVACLVTEAYPHWQDLARKTSNKWHVDLWEINARLLEAEGIERHNVSLSKLCTSCRSDLFYSFRRDRRNTGRMASTCILRPVVSSHSGGRL
jgi:YfiH family protein